MASVGSELQQRASRAVVDRLAELVAVEARIVDRSELWGDAVRAWPEAAAIIERMRTASTSRRAALLRRIVAKDGRRGPGADGSPITQAPPALASDALRQAAEAAFAATLAYEAAYQTARLAYDGETCDIIEGDLSDHVATLADLRAALPDTIARELRDEGITCTCGCPMCSLGACGCIRATLATVDLAWTGVERPRASGLTLLSPPRPGSQLADAGLAEGDLILAVDGEEVGRNGEMQDCLCRQAVGEDVRLEVERRGGQRYLLTVRRVA